MRTLDGHTTTKHKAIYAKICHLLMINPTELLKRDRSLLRIVFDSLGSGPSENRQIWCTSMNTALAAAKHPLANNYIDAKFY